MSGPRKTGAPGVTAFSSSVEERTSLLSPLAGLLEAEQLQAAKPSPSARIAELAAIESPLHQVQIPGEILELAEEISSRSEEPGLSPSTLRFLLKLTLYLGRVS